MKIPKLSPLWLKWPQTQLLVKAFAAHPGSLRFVGGAVRDAVLEIPVVEIDAATTMLPDAVMSLLAEAGIKAIPTGIDHGTVTAVINSKAFEITTLRKDVDCDGRHAEVAFTDDWKEDASRRDFTMNAMYLSPDGKIFDYFGGYYDLQEGRIRFIGDPLARIREDYLRILRFFRFNAIYGMGPPDEYAIAACSAEAPHMEVLSGERIQQELLKLLAAPKAATALSIMQGNGMLEHVLGVPVSGCGMFEKLAIIERVIKLKLPPYSKLVGFALQSGINAEDALKKMATRLKLPGQAEKNLSMILKNHAEINVAINDAGQKRLLRKLGGEIFMQAIIVQWAYGSEPVLPKHPYTVMLKLPSRWQLPVFPVGGDDMIAAGMAPGPDMGIELKKLEDEWETSNYTLTKEELISLLLRRQNSRR